MRRLLMIPVLIAALVAAACSTSWVQTAEEYIAVLVPAVQDVIGILAIAGVKGISTTMLNTVSRYAEQATNDLNTINTLLTQYNGGDPTTLAQRIDVAANDAKTNLSSILPALHISDPATATKITAAVGLAVNTIGSLEMLVPGSANSIKPALSRKATKPLSPGALQEQFNRIFSR